jgi:hypothetical protein
MTRKYTWRMVLSKQVSCPIPERPEGRRKDLFETGFIFTSILEAARLAL